MQNILFVIDMQNDFINGALGTPEAVAILPNVVQRIREFDGPVYFTRDTHGENYFETQEGQKLPVLHCVKGTPGWELAPEIEALRKTTPWDKETFGCKDLGPALLEMDAADPIESITMIGICTDICVISNAMLAKAFLPNVPVRVDASCCAGVTPESHETALKAMAACQIEIL